MSTISVAPAPQFLYWRETLSTWTLSTTVTRQPTPLDYEPCAACLRMLPFPASVFPPFSALGLHTGPCNPLGGYTIVDNYVSLVPLPLPPYFMLRLLGSSGSWFLFGRPFSCEGERPGRLHSLKISCPSPRPPPLLDHSGSVKATRLPGYTPPTPPCRLDPISMGWRRWGLALEVSHTRAFSVMVEAARLSKPRSDHHNY